MNNSKEYIRLHYRKYWGSKKGIKGTSARVMARRLMERRGLVRKGDGKEVDHINGVDKGNGKSNLRVISRLKNRRLGQKKATISRKNNS